MKIVIAPDKFKDCLPALEVAQAMARGLRKSDATAEIDICPMADGGEGTVDAVVAATNGRFETVEVTGPFPTMRIAARYGILGDQKTAVLEMSAASGLNLLQVMERDPFGTTTFGTGELLLAAAQNPDIETIILGIGGSATMDLGLGCAQACGARIRLNSGILLDPTSRPLRGADLPEIANIDYASIQLNRNRRLRILVARDVANPLTGPNGAARIFGPQKGATATGIEILEKAFQSIIGLLHAKDIAATSGAGAAGGLGFGMLHFFGAELRSGIDIVIESVRLGDRLKNASFCITGEGRLDASSLSGKTPIGVARVCAKLNIPCYALAGAIEASDKALQDAGIQKAISLSDNRSKASAITDAQTLLETESRNLLAFHKSRF